MSKAISSYPKEERKEVVMRRILAATDKDFIPGLGTLAALEAFEKMRKTQKTK